jgi:hypothetical protein
LKKKQLSDQSTQCKIPEEYSRFLEWAYANINGATDTFKPTAVQLEHLNDLDGHISSLAQEELDKILAGFSEYVAYSIKPLELIRIAIALRESVVVPKKLLDNIDRISLMLYAERMRELNQRIGDFSFEENCENKITITQIERNLILECFGYFTIYRYAFGKKVEAR